MIPGSFTQVFYPCFHYESINKLCLHTCYACFTVSVSGLLRAQICMQAQPAKTLKIKQRFELISP
jgi:hypothetical protein